MQDHVMELRELLEARSIRRGDFVLASGDHSKFYCDTKATTLSPEGATLVGEVLCQAIVPSGAVAVGGLAMGATFLATAVVCASLRNRTLLYGFTVRDSQKTHGLRTKIEESYYPDGSRLLSPGRKVSIIDDVVTKGTSVCKAIDAVRELGCEIVQVISLIDRCAGGAELIQGRGLPYVSVYYTDPEGNLNINAELFEHSSARFAVGAGHAR